MSDCIFCKIVRGEIPCAKIFEDTHVLSFMDINPINRGHALIIPKQHYATLFEVPPDELQACIVVAQRVARAVYRATAADGLNLVQNNLKAAGQLIDHVHFHAIPRHHNDGFLTSWPGKPYPDGELSKMLEKIRANFEAAT